MYMYMYMHMYMYMYFITYQCYVYRTNIRHIPPEVAWECDTTSVIRCEFYGGEMLNFVCEIFVFATSRHTEHCALLVVFDNAIRR